MDLNTKQGRETVFGRTLKWLQAGAPHQPLNGFPKVGFNMGVVTATDAKDWEGMRCGTTCCILGHVKLQADFKIEAIRVARNTEVWTEGAPPPPLMVLFYPSVDLLNSSQELRDKKVTDWLTLTNIRPSWAALTLAHYIETGETDWLRFKAEGMA